MKEISKMSEVHVSHEVPRVAPQTEEEAREISKLSEVQVPVEIPATAAIYD